MTFIRLCPIMSDMKRPNRTKHRNVPRAFVRDGALTIRMPATFKTKLQWLAGRIHRDTSNLGLEFLQRGADRLEAELNGVPNAGSNHDQIHLPAQARNA